MVANTSLKPDPRVYPSLIPLCLTGLQAAANSATGLFDLQIRDRKPAQPTQGTESITSTFICLIGLDRAGIALMELGLSPQRTLATAFETVARQHAYGATGLALWANAVMDATPFEDVLDRIGVTMIDEQGWVDRLTTMELAWLVCGMLHELKRKRAKPTLGLTIQFISALSRRFDEKAALVSHASSAAPLRHWLRRRLPNFADQIYTVQALSMAALMVDDEVALDRAQQIAARLTELQGRLGQWWWHYDVSSGRVAEGYPVYSVHQHAMAPMALMALRAAGGRDHSRATELGQSWILNNELGVNLIDETANAIWRDIERREPPLLSFGNKVLELTGRHRESDVRSAMLQLNHEIRPYEWGWCLYAAAIHSGGAKEGHIV